jgi:NAD(P)-dependent dehydrogenase (short-subunit alcohol dehydrogenase family)
VGTAESESRRALVTGAARGIGAAIADRLAEEGFEVVTADRDAGTDLRFDVATGELPDLSAFDVCVSNAAITDTIGGAHKLSPEQWQRDIDVNLTGAFRVAQACLLGMRERGYGRIVFISSGAAAHGLPGQAAYAASKAGLLGLMRTIAAENAHRGVTANAVLPGMVATEKVLGMPPEILERLLTALPAGRFAEPGEIAALVAHLASEEAGSTTGQAIEVDGGAALNTFSLTRNR